MNKLIILMFFIIKINIVYSCSSSSAPSCEEKKDENYEERCNFITNLPSSLQMNRIALPGTHNSLSYLSGNITTKTQELDILFQLKHGIRVFEIPVEARNNTLAVYSGSMNIPQMFEEVLIKTNKFLEVNFKEFIIFIFRDDNYHVNEIEGGNCRIIDWLIRNNLDIGWRLVKDWSFDDPIGVNRGKILLAAFGNAFDGCAVNFEVECKNENYKASSVAEKWQKIVEFQEKCYLEYSNCYIYHTSVQTDKGVRANAKYGGYTVDGHCMEPINHRMADFFYPTKRGLFIVLMDYPTEKLLARIIKSNHRTLKNMYYWETVKKKFLYKKNRKYLLLRNE